MPGGRVGLDQPVDERVHQRPTDDGMAVSNGLGSQRTAFSAAGCELVGTAAFEDTAIDRRQWQGPEPRDEVTKKYLPVTVMCRGPQNAATTLEPILEVLPERLIHGCGSWLASVQTWRTNTVTTTLPTLDYRFPHTGRTAVKTWLS